MKDLEILKARYADFLDLIDFNDYKNIKGSRFFKLKCKTCGSDRGYQQIKFANRNCNDCANTERVKDKDTHGVVNFLDYEVRSGQRFYRATCYKCRADRGYIEPKNFKKSCLSCARIKKIHKTVDYRDYKNINKLRHYRQSCKDCGIDKGYQPLSLANRRCKKCSNAYVSKLKTKLSDSHRKVRHSMSVCIYTRLKKRKSSKQSVSIFDVLGYSFEDLCSHLENQFEPWMSWDNYGIYDPKRKTWNIDHIVPDSSFDYESIYCDDFKKSWSLSNLRPLSAIENIIKSNNE